MEKSIQYRFIRSWAIGILSFLLGSSSLFAQTATYDTTLQIQEIEIKDSRLTNFTSGNSTDSMAVSVASGLNLPQLLEYHSSLFIRSYGLGSLATTSLRGGSSSHTAVLWNGINLQSPTNGVVDLALLPAFFSDSVYVQYGGNSALWGSGAMGGTIHLKSKRVQKGVSAHLWGEVGSFRQFQQGGEVSVSSKKLSTRIKLWNQSAENDFSFNNRTKFNNPEEIQSNAALSIQGATLEQTLQSNVGAFQLSGWWQQSDREIPPSLTVNQSNANQEDESIRLSLQWKKAFGTHSLSIQSAYLNDRLLFEDEAINLVSNSRSIQYHSTIQHETLVKNRVQLLSGLQHILEHAETDNYLDIPQRNRLSLATSAKWNNRVGNLTLLASGRQEWTSTTGLVPFIPSLSSIWQASPFIEIKATVNRSFRLPTFNDLFWQPGGNPNLKSEIGWAQELTTTIQSSKGKPSFSVVVFNKNLDNQIVWQPTERGYWAPFNLQGVWIRGTELSSSYHKQMGKFRLLGRVSYQFLKASQTSQEAESNAMLYTPENQYRFMLNLQYKKMELNYLHQITGKRYITTDFSRELPHYQTANLSINSEVVFNKIVSKIWFSIDNIWNEQYEVIAFRPMPGRNFKTGLSIFIK